MRAQRKQWMSIVSVQMSPEVVRRRKFVDRNLSMEIVAVDRRRKWKCPHHPSLLRLNKSAKKTFDAAHAAAISWISKCKDQQ